MRKLILLTAFILYASICAHGQVTTQNARRLPDKNGVPSGSCVSGPPFVDVQFDISTSPPTQYVCKAGSFTASSGPGAGSVTGPASATAGDFPLLDATGKVLSDSGKAPSTDGTLGSNSDLKIPTEKAVKTYADTKQAAGNYITGLTGDGTAAGPGNVALSVVKVNGNTPGGTCTNKFARSIDSSGRPTCDSVVTADLPTTVVQTNQANIYGAFSQTFQSGTQFILDDPLNITKQAEFVLSNITAGQVRNITIPDANSVTVVPDTGAANNFLTAISVLGAISKARPTCSSLSDAGAGCSSAAGGVQSVFGRTGAVVAATNDYTPTQVGLGNLTNDTQTKAAVVPNTAPSAGQVPIGNAGGTAYVPLSFSQDCTMTSGGVVTCLKTNNVSFGALATVTPGTGVATALAINVGSAGAPVINGGVLGTPSSGTGTNITGIPAASILAGSFGAGAYVISTSLQVATIELGAATDTTLSRVSAGVIAVEGVNILASGATGVQTFLTTPSSANLRAALTDELGTGAALFDGATPTGFVCTNCTGTASGLTAGSATTATTATNATNTAVTDDTTTNATMYPTWVTANTGNLPQKVSSTKFSFNPSTGTVTATVFSGSGASLTNVVNSITGTANQVVASGSTGAVTLSLPQSINTTASPQFGTMGLGVAADAQATSMLHTTRTTASVTTLGNSRALILDSTQGGTNEKTEIGFGYKQGNTFQPVIIGSNITNNGGSTIADFYVATRAGGTDIAPVVNLQVTGAGHVFMANVSTAAGFQTADACFGASGEVVSDSVLCLASSKRFKERIKPLTSNLNEVLRMRPVTYFFKPEFNGPQFQKDPNYSGEREGFLAEDMQKIDPRLVTVEKDGITPHGIRYQELGPRFAGAIQELNAKFEAYKQATDAKIASQQRTISRLRNRR